MARRSRRQLRFHIEHLERRQLLASNRLILDFTPDNIPGENVQTAFVDSFRDTARKGTAGFLDFNGDGRVDDRDARRAMNAIRRRVAQYFRYLPIRVRAGDKFSDSNLGQRWLRRGQRDPDLYVVVVYVGGQSPAGPSIWGEAYQAPVGRNHEYYAYAYADAIMKWFEKYAPNAAPARFRDEVALTIAHEAGHLMGLGHPKGHPPGLPSVMNYSAPADRARFINRSYLAEALTWRGVVYQQQNPRAELLASLRGQRDAHWYARYSSARSHPRLVLDQAPSAQRSPLSTPRAANRLPAHTAWVDAVLEQGVDQLLV